MRFGHSILNRQSNDATDIQGLLEEYLAPLSMSSVTDQSRLPTSPPTSDREAQRALLWKVPWGI